MNRPNNIVRVPCNNLTAFFKYWFLFLKPFHNLTDREIDIATAFVKHRYDLSKVIKDKDILDKVVMSEDTKKKIMEECEISLPHFQVILGKLRKSKVIVDNRVNPRFIPNLSENEGNFNLLLLFDIK